MKVSSSEMTVPENEEEEVIIIDLGVNL